MNGGGKLVTEAILDKWAARGARNHIIPLRLIPIFCRVTGSLLPLQALMPQGAELVSGPDLAYLKWARAEIEKRKITRETRRLAQEIGL
jgi:hypothetical protein